MPAEPHVPLPAPVERRRLVARLAVSVAAVGIAFCLSGGALLWVYARDLGSVVAEKFSGRRWALPSRVYSDPFLLHPGLSLEAGGFYDRLQRLNYRQVPDAPLRKGDFRRSEGALDLFLRDSPYPGQTGAGTQIRIELRNGIISRMEDVATSQELFAAQLEPEIITGLYDSIWEERHLVSLRDVPPLLTTAILLTEDQRFYEHHGVDPIGILRAMAVNVRHGQIVQGGSTLTQQLVKNFFLSEERTLERKVQEALMALLLERRFGKDEILEAYLNEIYLGQNGLQGVFGIWEASQFYFARPPQELSIAESALLAGLIRAPNRYSPYTHAEEARARRQVVLTLMAEAGAITAQQYAAAVSEPLRSIPLTGRANSAPYFVDFLQEELSQHYPRDILTSEGLRIFTALDVQLQRIAEQAVRQGLEDLERRHPRLRSTGEEGALEACLIALKPQTGEIRAMVGGRDYRRSQFNRVVHSKRQPGSIFKPFVYLAAFQQTRDSAEPVTAVTALEDEPFDWPYDGKNWRPENYRQRYAGRVSVRQALEHSLNAATARLAFRIGLQPILRTARELGIASPLPPYPSVVLGAGELSPFEVAQAFSVFANQGLRAEPRATRKVLDKEGAAIEGYPVEVTRAADPETTYLVEHLMEGVLDRGTGAAARQQGFSRPAAGKTGTTNDGHDAWFAGFTPDLLAVVWVGFDRDRALGLTGAAAALPIWTQFMKTATAAMPESPFLPPAGVALVRIDPYTGAVATPNCPETIDEAFLAGQEPKESCPVHREGRDAPAAEPPGVDSPAVAD